MRWLGRPAAAADMHLCPRVVSGHALEAPCLLSHPSTYWCYSCCLPIAASPSRHSSVPRSFLSVVIVGVGVANVALTTDYCLSNVSSVTPKSIVSPPGPPLKRRRISAAKKPAVKPPQLVEWTLPKDAICPITLESIDAPAFGSCGHVFEREAIMDW